MFTKYKFIGTLMTATMFFAFTHFASAQNDKPKKEEEIWRVGEKQFAEFMEMTEVRKKLDDGSIAAGPGQVSFTYPPRGKAAQRTPAEIEKACGTPYLSDTNNAGVRSVYYGRLGYATDDGKSVKKLCVVFSISSLKKPTEKKK